MLFVGEADVLTVNKQQMALSPWLISKLKYTIILLYLDWQYVNQ